MDQLIYTQCTLKLRNFWTFNAQKWMKLVENIGWIQTLFRERVKSQGLENLTLNSESASKIMPACDI